MHLLQTCASCPVPSLRFYFLVCFYICSVVQVTISGVVKVVSSEGEGGGARNKNKCLFLLYIDANSIHNSKTHSGDKSDSLQFTHKDLLAINEIAHEPDVFKLVVNSICPSIYGNEVAHTAFSLSLSLSLARARSLARSLSLSLACPPPSPTHPPSLSLSLSLFSCTQILQPGCQVGSCSCTLRWETEKRWRQEQTCSAWRPPCPYSGRAWAGQEPDASGPLQPSMV
jgi:hypothetical protein